MGVKVVLIGLSPHSILIIHTSALIAIGFLAYFVSRVEGSLSASFQAFIATRYGNATLELLNRDDLGADGAFGGGEHIGGMKTELVTLWRISIATLV